MKRRFGDQSAMEYLLTYGWAILIIAVILVVLFQLHIFEPAAYFSCLGQPGFLCSVPSLSSSGALTVNLSYNGYNYPITIIGLVCNVTSSPSLKANSTETTKITLNPGQQVRLVFQCPLSNTKIGSTSTIFLTIYYDTPTVPNLQQNFAKGVLAVQYSGISWNVTEWTVPGAHSPPYIQSLSYTTMQSNPASPTSWATKVKTFQWSSFVYSNLAGWAYSTDYHNHDVYNGIETILFPAYPLANDIAGPSPNLSNGYTATAVVDMGGQYTFSVWTDDGTQIFYKQWPSGSTWNPILPYNSQAPDSTCIGSPSTAGSAWNDQPPCFFSNTITFPSNSYEIAVDYIDTVDPAGLSVVQISPPPTQPN